MQKFRPSWLSLFDARLTLGLIVTITFMGILAAGNLIQLVQAFLAGNTLMALQNALSAILYAVPAWGLLKVQRWARLFEIIWSVLMVLLGIVVITQSIVTGAIIVITHGMIALYLMSKKCRKVFYPELSPDS
ncbi:MAG TPA: hypothetical protein PKA10_13020 [Selenomonadales bacterium]|nr:hypothetical protein [Selenomonadales bacterium]